MTATFIHPEPDRSWEAIYEGFHFNALIFGFCHKIRASFTNLKAIEVMWRTPEYVKKVTAYIPMILTAMERNLWKDESLVSSHLSDSLEKCCDRAGLGPEHVFPGVFHHLRAEAEK